MTGNTPVFVSPYDGHMVLANSAALLASRVTAQPPDPPRGTIGRDAHGNPTGLTSAQCIDDDDSETYNDLKIFSQLHDQGLLTTRLYVAPSIGQKNEPSLARPDRRGICPRASCARPEELNS